MVEPRTLLSVTIRITLKAGTGERFIRATLTRLPDDSPRDVERRIEKFEIRLEDRGRVNTYTRYSNSIREVKDGLCLRLHTLLEGINYNTHEIEVQEDSEGFLREYVVRCQYCPKTITHSRGRFHGLLKECPGCGSLTSGRFDPLSQ